MLKQESNSKQRFTTSQVTRKDFTVYRLFSDGRGFLIMSLSRTTSRPSREACRNKRWTTLCKSANAL